MSSALALLSSLLLVFFFFNDTATTEIYTLSLHDALPNFARVGVWLQEGADPELDIYPAVRETFEDRKSTRLNSSHSQLSYAVFCLKTKNQVSMELTAHDAARICQAGRMLAGAE